MLDALGRAFLPRYTGIKPTYMGSTHTVSHYMNVYASLNHEALPNY